MNSPRHSSGQRGQISVEYTVVLLALLVALFVPYGEEEKSVAVKFLDSVRVMYEKNAFVLSLP